MISIIIPVYHAENYITNCLDSVLSQTFKDYEVVLIVNPEGDEGSKAICEEYAKKDSRIRVVIAKTTGVAEARNIGVDSSSGEYIAFVDSDDYIQPNMLEIMLDKIIDDASDIAICQYYVEFDGVRNASNQGGKVVEGLADHGCMPPQEIIKLLASGTLENFLWNKLFKRELFLGIRFPDRDIFEDASVLYLLIHKSRNISLVDKPLYHYCKHNNSLTGKINISRRIATLDYFDEFFSFIKREYPEFGPFCGFILYRLCVTMAHFRIKVSTFERNNYYEEIGRHYKNYADNIVEVTEKLSPIQRIAFKCFLKQTLLGDIFGLGVEYIRRMVGKERKHGT